MHTLYLDHETKLLYHTLKEHLKFFLDHQVNHLSLYYMTFFYVNFRILRIQTYRYLILVYGFLIFSNIIVYIFPKLLSIKPLLKGREEDSIIDFSKLYI